MSFHGSPCHFQLASDLGVITALQKQLNDLLLPWTEPNGLLLHPNLPLLEIRLARQGGVLANLSDFIASTLPL